MTNHENGAQVWIINDAGHDFSKAERFGALKRLTVGNINPFHLDRLARDLSVGIVQDATPDDYLLISGTPILSGLALHLWLTRHGACKVLQWDAKKQDYRLSTFTLDTARAIVDKALFM